MDINSFIKSIKKVDWDNYSNIKYFDSKKVIRSLYKLAKVDKESLKGIHRLRGSNLNYLMNAKICNDVLSSIGNNHRGTYYLPVKDALPFIIQIALNGDNIVSRNCAIDILIDLCSFSSEPDSKELTSFVQETIRLVIENNKNNFIEFAKTDTRNDELIKFLFTCIDE